LGRLRLDGVAAPARAAMDPGMEEEIAGEACRQRKRPRSVDGKLAAPVDKAGVFEARRLLGFRRRNPRRSPQQGNAYVTITSPVQFDMPTGSPPFWCKLYVQSGTLPRKKKMQGWRSRGCFWDGGGGWAADRIRRSDKKAIVGSADEQHPGGAAGSAAIRMSCRRVRWPPETVEYWRVRNAPVVAEAAGCVSPLRGFEAAVPAREECSVSPGENVPPGSLRCP